MPPIKTVFHVHTNHSPDCNKSAEELLDIAQRRGIGCLVVTDHDAIEGAHEITAKAPADLKVVVGQEVTTTVGHIIGLYLRELVEPGMSLRDTALAIKRQGGLVVIPHPFNLIFGCGLCRHINEVIDLIDIIEVSNSQNICSTPNRKAQQFAEQHGFPQIVGVDMHFGDNLDACYQWIKPFDTQSEFVDALRQATLVKGRHTLAYFAWTAWYVLLDLSGIGMPASFGRNTRHRKPSLTPVLETYPVDNAFPQ